jgi:mono/diheme cytochrome c family protein
MRKAFKWGGIALAVLVVAMLGLYGWASHATATKLARTIDVHEVDLPLPASGEESELATAEAEALPGTVDAHAQAVERGRHLIHSRYVCVECHGEDLSGGVMIDDPAMGRLLGPNLTSGEGSVTRGYTMGDWDRIVRHGVRRDGRPAVMPSEDFLRMSDQELTDIVAYIQSVPPVDNEVPPVSVGPVATILLALGKFELSADLMKDHHAPHPSEPPPTADTVEFGGHLAQVCTGCHRGTFEGGPVVQGPPDWAPASNLTPHADGLAGWSFEQFDEVMRTGLRPDGTAVQAPMDMVPPFTKNMTETEMRALWRFLSSLPPTPTGT